ncbi:TIGR02587 family membrane protein [Aggregatilinea lenta]|uniref:TIGR02587 family membrane protein n=1 Tax=Aggregatilinea lenta TaxID=913108 RepID=UPI000E5A349E|nr:TIGR02587 family membrane protein [Aggregatilinea lenta]
MSQQAASAPPDARSSAVKSNTDFAIGLARAAAGAVIFALPMIMTMEMWFLGFTIARVKLALLLGLNFPLLVGLSHYFGFEETFELKEDLLDACVAYGVGFITSIVGLLVLGVIDPGMSADEIVGKVAIQAVPASLGALLAQSQLGQFNAEDEERQHPLTYGGVLFIMIAGALFLSLNLAPTEEIILIAFRMTIWHALILIGLSLAGMHGFVYTFKFRGQPDAPPGTPAWSLFIRFTVVGYVLALLVSLLVLWIFGRVENTAYDQILMIVVVLGFPAAIGAAAARLIL